MSIRNALAIVTTTALLTIGATGLGYYAGTHDTPSAPVTSNPVPTWAEPSDERTQDPTGIPYCDPYDPMYPCIDLTAMGYLDMWGDSGLIIADYIDTGEWAGYGAFTCDELAQDCQWIQPNSDTGLMYESDPNIYPLG